MREIKFRGKSINTNKWVYSETLSSGTIKRKRYNKYLEVDGKWIGVISETLSQFRLQDKNGNDIYDGDIVLSRTDNEKAIVKYSEHFQRLHLFFIGKYRNHLKNEHGIHIFDWIYPDSCLEIIGNIYEEK